MLKLRPVGFATAVITALLSVLPLTATSYANNSPLTEDLEENSLVPVKSANTQEPTTPADKNTTSYEQTTSDFLTNDNPLSPSSSSTSQITAPNGKPSSGGKVDTTAPNISKVSTSIISATSATIAWSTNEKTTSEIQYGLTTDYGRTTTLDTNLATTHSQALAGLSANTSYHYRILSRDAAGNLTVSKDFIFTTSAPPDITAPVISAISASGLTASSGTITWTTNEASTTQIQYGSGIDASGNPVYGNSTTLNNSLVTYHSQTLQNLASGTTYHYRVISKDAAGNTTTSQDYIFTTAGVTLQDAGLSSLMQTLLADGLLDREDMLDVFREVGIDGIVSTAEFSDLETIQLNPFLYTQLDYVHILADNVILGTADNAYYLGGTLGNLAAGSSASQLEKLVGKWFLGTDHPLTSYTYVNAVGSLFVDGATYTDIRQGAVGDCYLEASLAEVAFRDPSIILDMFIDNGDGTYTVKFYQNGVADYVTVDRQLPTSSGRLVYSGTGARVIDPVNDINTELWTALAEKAYIEINAKWGHRQNSYASIAADYIGYALGAITGFASRIGTYLTDFTSLVAAWTKCVFIGFCSKTIEPSGSPVVQNHAYAVVGYDSITQKFTLFNPWGIGYGLLVFTWSEIQAYYSYYDTATRESAPGNFLTSAQGLLGENLLTISMQPEPLPSLSANEKKYISSKITMKRRAPDAAATPLPLGKLFFTSDHKQPASTPSIQTDPLLGKALSYKNAKLHARLRLKQVLTKSKRFYSPDVMHAYSRLQSLFLGTNPRATALAKMWEQGAGSINLWNGQHGK